MAERLLRNRGRLRKYITLFHYSRSKHALNKFLLGEWHPKISNKESNISISLTSWGPRLHLLPIVLLFLLQQSIRPKQIFVWLTHQDYKSIPNNIINRFQSLDVCFEVCDNLKPHKKWLPMVEFGYLDPYVICDDDIIYPINWFESLLSEDRSDAFVGVRSHRLKYDANGLPLPYSKWEKMVSTNSLPSADLFITGGAGAIIYPNRISDFFRSRIEIESRCPLADDVWLNAAHASICIPKFKTRWSFPCLELPNSSIHALSNNNVDQDGNDVQVHNVKEYLSKNI